MEKSPKIDKDVLLKVITGEVSEEITELVNRINDKYEYWDKVKYKKLPNGYSPQILWSHVRALRLINSQVVWSKYGIRLFVTNAMQRMCHEFDMIFGGFWESNTITPEKEKMHYLASSLMEEAIYSSQMEGAATTRVVAKNMLKQGVSPKNKSQQMIYNNYQTIRYITEHKHEPLTVDRIQLLHNLMTDKTLKNVADAGRFRTAQDDVVVENKITGEIVHTPPPAENILDFINELCDFFNNTNDGVFIHPIIRGIIIHFMVAYVHPFVDGNGRTARALFYWYMLKEKYWLTEYMSISRVIAKSKRSYEDSFLYTEADGNDIGYFIAYNLRVLDLSFKQLKNYIERKQNEKQAANVFLKVENINQRQAQIIQYFVNNPQLVVTVKEMQERFAVTPMTARQDLIGLIHKGYIREIALNRVKKGYIATEKMDELIK
jgi:Fic family protein